MNAVYICFWSVFPFESAYIFPFGPKWAEAQTFEISAELKKPGLATAYYPADQTNGLRRLIVLRTATHIAPTSSVLIHNRNFDVPTVNVPSKTGVPTGGVTPFSLPPRLGHKARVVRMSIKI